VAGESGVVKKIRQHLFRERGFNAEDVQAAGFWKKRRKGLQRPGGGLKAMSAFFRRLHAMPPARCCVD